MTLRIQRSNERGSAVFRLTGRIQAGQIPDVKALLGSEFTDHRITLDLKDVRLVDRDAVRFLAQIEEQGARLRNCSAFIREWISQEQNRMQSREVNIGDPNAVRE
jgi:anti-anti-sigma regulatory factor